MVQLQWDHKPTDKIRAKQGNNEGAFPPYWRQLPLFLWCEESVCVCVSACLPVSSEVGQGDLVLCQISIDENFLVSFISMLSFYRITEIHKNSNTEDISLFFWQVPFPLNWAALRHTVWIHVMSPASFPMLLCTQVPFISKQIKTALQ